MRGQAGHPGLLSVSCSAQTLRYVHLFRTHPLCEVEPVLMLHVTGFLQLRSTQGVLNFIPLVLLIAYERLSCEIKWYQWEGVLLRKWGN